MMGEGRAGLREEVLRDSAQVDLPNGHGAHVGVPTLHVPLNQRHKESRGPHLVEP